MLLYSYKAIIHCLNILSIHCFSERSIIMAKINGKTVPFASPYAVNDIWSGSYKHSVRGTATTCLGFAYLIYNKIWGSDTYGETIDAFTLAGKKSDFDGIKVGAWVRGGKDSGDKYWHAMVIISIGTEEVTYYDCNRAGTNKIGTHKLSYADFKSRYTKIHYGYTPK